MRGSTKKTPTMKKKVEGGGVVSNNDKTLSAEKTSGKKLKQARLPFMIIASSTEKSGHDATKVGQTDTRKRKLSYDTESEQTESETTENCKENVSAVATKKPKTGVDDTAAVVADIVVLDDSSEDEEAHAKATNETKNKNSSKQTPKSVKGRQSKSGAGTPKQSKLGAGKNGNKSAKKTPKREVNVQSKENPKVLRNKDDTKKTPKQAATRDSNATNASPKKVNTAQNDDNNVDNATSTSTPSTHQNKRRKSLRNITKASTTEPKEHTDSSEDTEAIAIEHNPLKRIKVADDDKKTEDQTNIEAQNETPIVLLESSDENATKTTSSSEELDVNTTKPDDASNSDTDMKTKTKTNVNKNLTPKQQKLLEQRRKVREEKERKLQQDKEQKQREKEEREHAKKVEREQRDEQRRLEREEKEEQRRKEREEKDEQKRKEREEKDEQKRLEREEKERKRIAEQEAKNEEKRKKEQEKEEAEQKKKREAAAFTKFFLPKANTNGNEQQCQSADDVEATQLAFRPFQVKGDMKLAPIKRNSISTEARSELDKFFVPPNSDEKPHEPLAKSQLYISELSAGKRQPKKWSHPTTETVDDEVMIVEDDLARVGQAIDEEEKRPVERLRAKFLKFYENRRPPYYGTWRKKTTQIGARRPFKQDTKYLDYEVDSDLEWEEEEPGESLDGSGDEKDKESEDDEYEVDNEWFVPHGHLSDEELQNDEELDDGNTREAQQAKLQILQQEFAQEMRKETKKIKPRLIGCIWVDLNGNQPAECPNIIWETLDKRSMLCNGPISLEEPKQELNETESSTSPVEKVKAIVLTSELQKQLARLIHGNKHSKNFLINEYIAYLSAHVDAIKCGEALLPSKAMVREQIEEFAEWKVTEATEIQTSNNNNNNNSNGKKQKKPKKLLCWIVNNEALMRLELTMLTLENCWNYITTPKFTTTTNATTTETKDMKTIELNNTESKDDESKKDVQNDPVLIKTKKNIPTSIAKYTKILTPDERKATIKPKETASSTTAPTAAKANQTIKKRVPLLMSVPCGEQIPTAAKNALINQYLKKETTTTTKSTSQLITKAAIDQQPPALAEDDDDIIMLD